MTLIRWAWAWAALGAVILGCGGDGDGRPPQFTEGGEGHADPLGAPAGEARAGRLDAEQLPDFESGLQMWEGGDFVLANDRVAMVIEDVGPSDLYDPWGGRPLGVARVEGGQLVEPANFGELLLLTGRTTVVSQSVGVLNDGSDGGPAVVRAVGPLAPLPFFENLVQSIFPEDFAGVPTAIDYVLEPGAEHVDIFITHRSTRDTDLDASTTMHGYMYTLRLPTYGKGVGFATTGEELEGLGFIDHDATSYMYEAPGQVLKPGVEASGFKSSFTDGFTIPAHGELERHHARITIGGPGLDGLLQTTARREGTALRNVSGVVRDWAGEPAEGVRVHAETTDPEPEYLTRARTDASGEYTLHVPEGQEVQLTAYRQGDAVAAPVVVDTATSTQDLTLPETRLIHVTASDKNNPDSPLPVRVQVLAAGDTTLPVVPDHFDEPTSTGGRRLHIDFPMDGVTELRVPLGQWRVVVSRGYEYDIHEETLPIDAPGPAVEVTAELDRVVDTQDVMCGDFHIHTIRSNDSGDDVERKVRGAVADGLEIPVRSEHEYVESFQPTIEALGLEDHAFSLASVEMTSFVIWGHMGVVPLEPDPAAVNGGAPLWQRYPSADTPEAPVETLDPPEVFADVRARPEDPVVIINHPRGSTNYFDYTGYNRVTGTVDRPEAWDEDFRLVEVFNNSGWFDNLDETVADWLSFLDRGRRVFAVGSSDSHGMRYTPVGYPRTCLEVGTDDPRMLTTHGVRDALAAGNGTISGGIYVDIEVNGAGPGEEATGLGTTAMVSIRVQAASWVEADAFDVVVDGEIVGTVELDPADSPDGVTRYDGDLEIDVAEDGSYVLVAAYGHMPLDPVHPGKEPFGVTNPVFLSR